MEIILRKIQWPLGDPADLNIQTNGFFFNKKVFPLTKVLIEFGNKFTKNGWMEIEIQSPGHKMNNVRQQVAPLSPLK